MKWKKRGKGICLALVVVLMLGVGSIALAQERPQTVFSGGLSMWLWPGIGSVTSIDVGYEKALSTGLAFHGRGSLGLLSGVTNLGGLLGIKKYLGSTAPEGLWIGGFGAFSFFSAFGLSATTFGGGADAGYKYFFTPNLSIEPFAQVGYYTGGIGLAFTFGANVGFSF